MDTPLDNQSLTADADTTEPSGSAEAFGSGEYRSDEYRSDEAPQVPEIAFDLQILQSLRRLMRAADLFSKRLVKAHRITSPQLTCLHRLLESDGLTVSQLSRAMFLSPSTVVGILDRLESQGLVTRVRSAKDRRKVLIHVTQSGRDLVVAAPSPLQRALQSGLAELPEYDQRTMADSLARIVRMLELDKLDAAPLLESSEHLAADWGEPGDGSPSTDPDDRIL